MSRIDGNVTDFSPRTSDGGHGSGTVGCWICQTTLSTRAAFCHDCGTIQPPRALDHFARLGLDCRYEIDRAQLEGRFKAMSRIFDAERFAAKGPRQKQIAQDHLAALDEARVALLDPVRRAEYLLSLLEVPGVSAALEANSNDLDVMRGQVETASDTATVDKVASQAGRLMESCISDLAVAFRGHAFEDVAVILARLDQLEEIVTLARQRRADV